MAHTDLDDQPRAMSVNLGRPLPSISRDGIPVLEPTEPESPVTAAPARHSQLAEGLHFSGRAQISDSLSVGGVFEGTIEPSGASQASVIVSETGKVIGDVRAAKVSVLGQVDGQIDAGSGEVALHDGATVNGAVRYGRIQVNGANLNATLERVRGD